jgi:hypothetical protein
LHEVTTGTGFTAQGATSGSAGDDTTFEIPLLDLHVEVLSGVQARVADMTIQEVVVCLAKLRTTLKDACQEVPGFKRNAVAPLKGAQWEDEELGASKPAQQLTRYLQLLLCITSSEASPRSTDARRALTMFLNSLAMKG